MNRILIIEDDTDINNMMAEALQKSGYECTQAFSGTEGLLYIERDAFSLAVLDLMLPGMNGEKLLPQIKEKQNIPVIVVSAKDSIDSKVGLLTSGAEDYLTKPFAFDELLARIRVLLRRSSSDKAVVLTAEDLTMELSTRTVRRAGQEITLSSKEYAILEYLLRNKGVVLSRAQLESHVWDYDFEGGSNIVDVYVRYLRRKIDDPFEKKLIQTVRGVGYTIRQTP